MGLLTLSILSTLVAAAALTRLARPKSLWALVAVFAASWWALVVAIGEGVGRFVFTPTSVAAASVAVGIAGACVLIKTRPTPDTRHVTELHIALRTPAAKLLLLAWAALLVYSAVSIWTLSASVPDVMRYHLPQAVAWVREARVGVVPELDYRANYFPHNAQLTNAFVLVLSGEHRLMGLPSLVFSGVLWVGVCALALRACGLARRWALVFALAAASVGPVLLQMRAEMPDTAHTAAVVLALVTAIDQRRWFGRAWLPFALAAGLALGSKSSGPLVLGVLLGTWALGSLRVNAWSLSRAVHSARVLPAVLTGIIVAAVGGWVFLNNLVTHANPVFPMALKIGPFTLPGPGPSSGITMNPWIYDFGASPLERIVGGLARWPRLLLHMPPFDDMSRPAASGFGYIVPLALLGTVLALVSATVRGRLSVLMRPVTSRHAHTTRWVLIGSLLAYNVLFLSFVSLITAPWSTVDARYQIHLALIAVLLMCWSGTAAKPRVRRIWAGVVAAVAALMMLKSVDHGGHRGYDRVKAAIRGDHDPTWAYSGNPAFLVNDPGALNETLGDSDVILFGRGWVYPLMLPDLTRRVYPAGGKGPHIAVVDSLGIDDATMLALTERSHAKYELQREHEDWEERFAAYNTRWMNGGGRELLRGYFPMLARATGARFLVARNGRHPWFDHNPEWVFVSEDVDGTGTQRTAVYRFVGDTPP